MNSNRLEFKEQRKRGIWGDENVIKAACELFEVRIDVIEILPAADGSKMAATMTIAPPHLANSTSVIHLALVQRKHYMFGCPLEKVTAISHLL